MDLEDMEAMRDLIARAFHAGAELQRGSDEALDLLEAVYASLNDALEESLRKQLGRS